MIPRKKLVGRSGYFTSTFSYCSGKDKEVSLVSQATFSQIDQLPKTLKLSGTPLIGSDTFLQTNFFWSMLKNYETKICSQKIFAIEPKISEANCRQKDKRIQNYINKQNEDHSRFFQPADNFVRLNSKINDLKNHVPNQSRKKTKTGISNPRQTAYPPIKRVKAELTRPKHSNWTDSGDLVGDLIRFKSPECSTPPNSERGSQIDFDAISKLDLKAEIEKHIQPQPSFDHFDIVESPVFTDKRAFTDAFSSQQNNRNVKNFNFFNLKSVLSRFLLNKELCEKTLNKLSAFERLILQTCLVTHGYIPQNQRFCLSKQNLSGLLVVKLKMNSLGRMLRLALKYVLKHLKCPFAAGRVHKSFYSETGPTSLDPHGNARFNNRYFGAELARLTQLEHHYFTEDSLSRSQFFFTNKSRQSRLCPVFKDIQKYVLGKSPCIDRRNFSSCVYSIDGSQIAEHHKYVIREKIGQKLASYEIELNQFDPQKDQTQILEQMGLILRDLRLNPRAEIPCNILELDEAVQMLLSYAKLA